MPTNAYSNFIWRFLERCGAQLVKLLVELILARILSPSEYGLIALITVFTTILEVFVDSGLGNALIQKKDADNEDFSTVFFFNLMLCAILYILIFVFAPTIASFYGKNELVPLIRVLSITVIISGLKNVQQAYVSRTMQFKKFFFATLAGTIGAAIIGIMLALNGFGVWALVAQQLFNCALDTIILWFIVKWRPTLIFSIEKLKCLLSFGWKILVSSLLDVIYNNLHQLVIGKCYSSDSLAKYNRGQQIPNIIVSNINSSIDSILLPTMSKAQDDPNQVKSMTKKAIKVSTYLMAPLMIGLFVVAEPLVRIILTEKWIECIPFLRIYCIIYVFFPIHTANLNAIKAVGRSDIFLKLEIVKKCVGITSLVITFRYGLMSIAYGVLIVSFISQVINSWPNKKLINYSYLEQLKDILPGISVAVFMGVIVYPISLLQIVDGCILFLQIAVGIFSFIVLSKVFHIDTFQYLLYLVSDRLKKNR